MDLAGRRAPLWIAVGLVAAALTWSHLTGGEDEPAPDTREYAQAQLAAAEGVPMVLPVTLPAGYDYGRLYSFDSGSRDQTGDGTSLTDLGLPEGYGGADASWRHADSREVVFFPDPDRSSDDDDLPIVAVCVQPTSLDDEPCSESQDARHLQRHLGGTRVAIYVASKDHHDVSAWRDLALTTDLSRVRWLH
ncbi:hypothetical protein [Actinopolymorpha pittospori]